MTRTIAGIVIGASLVAAAVFAFVATSPAPKPEPSFVPLLRLKLQDAESERDRLRAKVQWLEAENAAWKRLAQMPEKRID